MNFHSKNTNFPCLGQPVLNRWHCSLVKSLPGGRKTRGSSDLMEKADLKYKNYKQQWCSQQDDPFHVNFACTKTYLTFSTLSLSLYFVQKDNCQELWHHMNFPLVSHHRFQEHIFFLVVFHLATESSLSSCFWKMVSSAAYSFSECPTGHLLHSWHSAPCTSFDSGRQSL